MISPSAAEVRAPQVDHDLANFQQFIRSARGTYFLDSDDFKRNFGFRLIDALEASQAEVERLTRAMASGSDTLKQMRRAEKAESALTAAQERIAELADATDELLGAWPADSLPPHQIAVRVALALNAARATLSPAVKEPK